MSEGFNMNKKLPLLPLRDIVMFPNMIVPLFVGREKSIFSIDKALDDTKEIILVTQREPSDENPNLEDIYEVGTLSEILQILKLPDGTIKILVKGLKRVEIKELFSKKEIWEASYEEVEDIIDTEPDQIEALQRAAIESLERYVNLNKRIHPEILGSINKADSPSVISDIISTHLILKISKKQALLETYNLRERFDALIENLESEIKVLQVEKKIKSRVKSQMEKSQREYYLNEQMKAIQRELGDGDDEMQDEITELNNKVKHLKLSEEAREKANSEIKKLKLMNPMSAEASVIRNYLDWLLELPWGKKTNLNKKLPKAKKILDREHSGLAKVKDRILEHIAVQTKVKKTYGQIICFMGPPGVGKTSLAKSIAEAVGRKFVRIALGGVKDESEIRGHRRTYIGSMPGKIIQAIKKAGSSNPLILLDEIDKVGSDWKGDPASALLEVLDAEQNSTFNDHYLEVDFDLSDVMFLTTANTYDMPKPLLDRLEIIRLSGYTEEEKLDIAKQHLVKKQMKAHGLADKEVSFTDKALMKIIQNYTREAGVRNLEREIANIMRKITREIVEKGCTSVKVTDKNLKNYAGIQKFEHQNANTENMVGVATGLAWTEVGGEILSIESLIMPGKGNVTLTGKLGEVMQESIKAAISLVKSRALDYNIDPKKFNENDVHVHVPEGAIPKDGPSAGIAMVTTIASVFSNIPIRKDVAMTGEITLHGKVLPIGGLKEKLLAAHRSGIKTIVIPKDNQKDLEEIPENILSGLDINPVSNIDEVLAIALVSRLEGRAAKPKTRSKKSSESRTSETLV